MTMVLRPIDLLCSAIIINAHIMSPVALSQLCFIILLANRLETSILAISPPVNGMHLASTDSPEQICASQVRHLVAPVIF